MKIISGLFIYVLKCYRVHSLHRIHGLEYNTQIAARYLWVGCQFRNVWYLFSRVWPKRKWLITKSEKLVVMLICHEYTHISAAVSCLKLAEKIFMIPSSIKKNRTKQTRAFPPHSPYFLSEGTKLIFFACWASGRRSKYYLLKFPFSTFNSSKEQAKKQLVNGVIGSVPNQELGCSGPDEDRTHIMTIKISASQLTIWRNQHISSRGFLSLLACNKKDEKKKRSR